MPVEMRVIYLLMLKSPEEIFGDLFWLKDYEATMMLRRTNILPLSTRNAKIAGMLWELNRDEYPNPICLAEW